jgi:hypothetical protein
MSRTYGLEVHGINIYSQEEYPTARAILRYRRGYPAKRRAANKLCYSV